MNEINNLTLDSREVAKMLSKAHAHLVRDISKYKQYLNQNPKLDSDDFWQETSYTSGTGKNYKCYRITKKGCEFLAHKMTGKKGAIFTATYINRFYEMEDALKNEESFNKDNSVVLPKGLKKKYTYNGRIVMPSMYLTSLTGIANATYLQVAKRFQLSYTLLQGEKLAAFKKENGITDNCASRMIVYPQSTALALVNSQKCFQEFKTVIRQYFKVDGLPEWQQERDMHSCRTKEFDEQIKKLRRRLIALDEVLENFGRYMRPIERHGMYQRICHEFGSDIMSDIVMLKDTTPYIEREKDRFDCK